MPGVMPSVLQKRGNGGDKTVSKQASKDRAMYEWWLSATSNVKKSTGKNSKRKDRTGNKETEMDSGGGNKRRKKTDGDDTSKGAKDVDGELTPQAFRAKMGINVDRQDCPNPFQAFAATPFPKLLLNAVQKAGFSSPSAIQSQCWPIALAGKDLIAIAKTGSGKTLGYLFPAFNLLSTYPTECRPGDGPVAVALAPTRELAMQIQSECERFCTVLKLTA
eukprot:2544715-Rhodomonas_salina.2